jgi:hypothetical protein
LGLPAIEEKTPELGLTEAPILAEPLVEISQVPNAIIDKGPEIIEPPAADLELLLIELDANPFEVQPEKSIEAEPASGK